MKRTRSTTEIARLWGSTSRPDAQCDAGARARHAGIPELLAELEPHGEVVLALLTGNIERVRG